jgi:hypothetical protein
MKRVGIYIALFGIAAIILPYYNRQLSILSWIDNWGETAAWAIKIGLIVVGVALFIMLKNKDVELELPQDETAE